MEVMVAKRKLEGIGSKEDKEESTKHLGNHRYTYAQRTGEVVGNETGQISKGLNQENKYLMLKSLDFNLWGEPMKGSEVET